MISKNVKKILFLQNFLTFFTLFCKNSINKFCFCILTLLFVIAREYMEHDGTIRGRSTSTGINSGRS